jgi:hypothetical protein
MTGRHGAQRDKRARWPGIARLVGAAVAVAAVVPAAASGAPGHPATGPRSLTGLAVPGTRILYGGAAAMDTALDRVADLGVRWLRVDAAWSELETAPGRWEWDNLDRLVGGARARGLSVLLVLGTCAPWVRPDAADWNHGPTTDAERRGFAGFAATTARRYKGRVAAYEIWNEPNLPGSWSPTPSPAAYLELLTAAYRAVHDADPAAEVLSGGTGGGRTGVDSVAWHEALYAGGLRTVSDGVAVHPYPDAPVADSGELVKATEIRAVMDANGDAAKPLWGTEVGAPTGGDPSVAEAEQAALVGQVYDRWSRISRAGPLFYYTLYDFGGTDREDHFGLLRLDGSRKPAYQRLRDWADS